MRNETDTGVVEAMICHWIDWVSPGRIAVGGDGALERVILASGASGSAGSAGAAVAPTAHSNASRSSPATSTVHQTSLLTCPWYPPNFDRSRMQNHTNLTN